MLLSVDSGSALIIFMSRATQYEVWVLGPERWELLAAFTDFEPAAGIAQLRAERIRLVHVSYEDGAELDRELVMEIGATRKWE